MKQVFVGTQSNVVEFSDLDSRDRICELRVMIATAYVLLRDAIGEKAKDEANVFHGPWTVFRNLMNEHPTACLEEYRRASIYFDADTDGKITEIANLIEQHIELTRQSIDLKGVHQHQADLVIGLEKDTASSNAHIRQGIGKTRTINAYRNLADLMKSYLDQAKESESVFAFCCILTKKLKSDCYDMYSDMTQEEMISCVRTLIMESSQSTNIINGHIVSSIEELSMPHFDYIHEGRFEQDDCADDETYALRA